MRPQIRASIVVAALAVAVVFIDAGSAEAQVRHFDVPAQPAQSGLLALGRQSGLQLLASRRDLDGVRINAVRGDHDVRDAVRMALRGTGIRITADDGRTLLLRSARAAGGTLPSSVGGEYGREIVHEPPLSTVLDDVVVTGVARATEKFRTSYAISTLSETQIARLAPSSSADLIGRLPGFYAESSGGESNNNISPRGLPGNFGTRFVAVQEDGVGFFLDPNEIYLNGDTFLRADIMVEGVEAVRSGPSAIFASNAPAGLINTITRKGSETPEGALRLTWQDTGYYRADSYWSGPVADGWALAAGGFWRIHDGFRDPGFPADRGGQFRVNLTRRLNGGGEFTAYAKIIDETNIFYLPIPLKDPRDGGSLSDLLDPRTGTLISDANRRYGVRTFDGAETVELERDLSDGRRTRAFMSGLEFRRQFGNGWSIDNRFRYFKASVNLDAMFTTTAPQDGDAYLSARLDRARTAFGPGVARLQYVLADARTTAGDRLAWDPATTRNLVIESSYRYVPSDHLTVSNELRITRAFSGIGPGRHELTMGSSLGYAELSHARLLQDGLHELNAEARRLDILALDAAGNVLGALTEDGFHRYGSYFIGGQVEARQIAGYLIDSWSVNDRLTIDLGYRRERYSHFGVRNLTESRDLGESSTTADDAVQGDSGLTRSFRIRRTNAAWTAGANLGVTSDFAVFGRYTRAFRGQNLWAVVTETKTPDDRITGYEVGLKYNTPRLQLFTTLFYTDFDQLGILGPTINPVTGANESTTYWGKVESKGVESEFAWRPAAWFSLDGNLTWQQPRQRDVQETRYGSLGAAYNDKLPARVPEWLIRVEPTVHASVANRPTTLFIRAAYVGRRFVDSLNTTRLPAYATVDAGLGVEVDRLNLQLTGSNLFNEVGLTEGNPRLDTITGQGTDVAIFARPIFGRTLRLEATYRW